ncbi:MAG: hypothetical protein OEU86_02395 [Gammaproteobacteria bacterium]|nr:hypothetical protein [Gammaproteobacteria bacterium]
MTTKASKRPFSVTALSLLMGWLAFAGLANAWAILNDTYDLPFYYGAVALAYGVSAGAAAVLLWRMQSAALITIRAWMILCIAFILMFGFSMGDIVQGGLMGLFGFAIFIGVIFAMLDRFVKRHTLSPTPEDSAQ